MKMLQILAFVLAGLSLAHGQMTAEDFDRTTIIKAAENAIAWTQSVIDDISKFVPPDAAPVVPKRSGNPRGWVQGAFLVGMKDWAMTTENEAHWQWLKARAESQSFKLGDRKYHADDHVVGQYYIALAEHFDIEEAKGPVTATFDEIITNPSNVDLNHSIPASPENMALDYSLACQFRWCWCDALFMSPPTFMALSRSTGDPKYLEFADKEYMATTEYLFREFDDIPGGLYLRDSTFFDPKKDANGRLIFWSRGNGWVFAGLPAVLRALPVAFPGRSRYLDIYEKMAQALKATQVKEGDFAGFWGPSLRGFDLFPTPESSGTAFFVGSFAWGIAEGILPADEYLEVAKNGWSALLNVQAEDGSIGWTQQIGTQPDAVRPDGVQLYGVGGFLQAAAGMLRLYEMGMLEEGDFEGMYGYGSLF